MLGRARIVGDLVAHAREGHAIVIYGPQGCGASTILDGIAAELSDRPIVRVGELRERADLTMAVAKAYGRVHRSARVARAEAFDVARQKPGVVLVDRVIRGTAATRADIRTLGALGMGAILAAEVNHAKDHLRIRAMRLAHRELAIPPLDRGQLRQIIDARLDRSARLIVRADLERLVSAADGRPGLIAKMADRLGDPRYWRGGRVLVEPLRADAVS